MIDYLPAERIESSHRCVFAPVSGPVSPLSHFDSPLFSLGLLGEGVCIQMQSHTLTSPIDGDLLAIEEGARTWRFRAQDGTLVLLHIQASDQAIIEHIKLTTVKPKKVRHGERLAYYDLRQFQSAPKLAMIITHQPIGGSVYYCQHHVQATEPLLLLTN